MAKIDQEQQPETASAPVAGVGTILRAARLRRKEELSEVAEALRIRSPFLLAIEEGRYNDLPGSAYAVGFLRAYADYLNLDADEVVRRFKAEAAGGFSNRSELVFPSVASEGRVPGGALLFLGLILAGAAYGGWYYASSDTSTAEMVPAIPERLSALLHGQPGAPAPAMDKVISPDGKPEAGKESEVVPPSEAEDEAKPQAAADAPAQAEPAAAQPAVAAPEPAPVAEPAKIAPKKTPAEEKADAVKAAAEKKAAEAKAEAAKQEAAKAASAATAPALEKTPETAPVEEKKVEAKPAEPAAPAAVPAVQADEPRIFGTENADSRITLKANMDCWIQVHEGATLLVTRLLRKGDSYLVPNRPGLMLMTGNAGALDVSIDGKSAPAIGPSGSVRRNVPLDPEKMAGG